MKNVTSFVHIDQNTNVAIIHQGASKVHIPRSWESYVQHHKVMFVMLPQLSLHTGASDFNIIIAWEFKILGELLSANPSRPECGVISYQRASVSTAALRATFACNWNVRD